VKNLVRLFCFFKGIIGYFRSMNYPTARIIRIKGLVQGVGFRPYVYRQAIRFEIKGWVENNNEGVTLHAEAESISLNRFEEALKDEIPEAASISAYASQETKFIGFEDFVIQKSSNLSDAITEVSPDIAVCNACLEDMKTQTHRIDYPFINCTNCGPRFTIIKDLPYDRHQTTMHAFELCETCKTEYKTITDRRFHAQPVACKNCGPSYQLSNGQYISDGKVLAEILAQYIDEGKIVALKGMGGYHLICNALDETTVKTLRFRKQRDGKPMAVMVKDLETARKYFKISEDEAVLLSSWRRPIVLVQNKLPLAASVSRALSRTGVILPYMPFHHQLMAQLKTEVIVLTSGNISEAPIIIADDEAKANLINIADSIITYNREIYNRTDDSVAFVLNHKARLIRRSRGYAPQPISLNLSAEGIFAAGAELVNTFAIGKGQQAILSQHIGDLKNAETLSFYEESFDRFKRLFRFKPEMMVCDLHPDYLSTRFAMESGLKVVQVQHHHAHIASCMAEHSLDEKVIGIALDGTGLGNDNTIWGGEFLIADLNDFSRAYFYDPIPLPGGDLVTKQPWRTAFSYLYHYFGLPIFIEEAAKNLLPNEYQLPILMQMIDKKINSPLSSGAGRLFDAVSALLGICRESSFHAEAPMRLEAIINPQCRGKYLFELEGQKISFRKLFHQILQDISQEVNPGDIAAKFHNTLIIINLHISKLLREESGINKVVLSGGSFQNAYLLEHTEQILMDQGFEVFSQEKVPSNDGGLSLGQLTIAAKRKQLGIS
jgi:hydrogenase maturation protein HypF